MKHPSWLAFWLTGPHSRPGITVATPRWNLTSFPIDFLPCEGRPEESQLALTGVLVRDGGGLMQGW